MGFDIFAAVMAVLSVLSFGMIGPADIIEDETEIPVISGVTDTKPQTPAEDKPSDTGKELDQTKPDVPAKPPTALPGAELIAGTWKGSASVPFVASMSFHAAVSADGTAQFSGEVSSSLFGDSTFDVPATWEYLGGKSFNTVIEGTDTRVTCDGKTLTFPANPYKLGLVDNDMADRDFTITLNRV